MTPAWKPFFHIDVPDANAVHVNIFCYIFQKNDVMQIKLCNQPDHNASQCSRTSCRFKKRASYLVRFAFYRFLIEMFYLT